MKKAKVIILGSTGTIGRNALSVIRRNRGMFEVLAVSAYKNISLLRRQIEEFKPRYAAVGDSRRAKKLSLLQGKTRILQGKEGINKIAGLKSDITVVGISGLAALEPLVNSLSSAGKVLLANKEVIIACGRLLKKKFPSFSDKVFPLDSELFSLWMILRSVRKEELNAVCITASGGPFRDRSREEMDKISLRDTLRHPNWKMGKKISVDSATLMNKGFEVIETQNIFGLSLDKIKVVVHRQSFLHAFVELKNGVILGTMFQPDMRIPISYGLGAPLHGEGSSRMRSFPACLDFSSPDLRRFPSLSLCRRAAEKGASFPLALVAADEAAVGLYLQKKIRLTSIYTLVKETLRRHQPQKIKAWDDVHRIGEWAKSMVLTLAERRFN